MFDSTVVVLELLAYLHAQCAHTHWRGAARGIMYMPIYLSRQWHSLTEWSLHVVLHNLGTKMFYKHFMQVKMWIRVFTKLFTTMSCHVTVLHLAHCFQLNLYDAVKQQKLRNKRKNWSPHTESQVVLCDLKTLLNYLCTLNKMFEKGFFQVGEPTQLMSSNQYWVCYVSCSKDSLDCVSSF